MYEMLDKQGSLKLTEDPVLTVASLNGKVNELNSVCGPIKRKPVPIKKKEEVPPPKEEKTEQAPMDGVEVEDSSKAGDGTPMETN